MNNMNKPLVKYWRWLFSGQGYKSVLNVWLVLHFIIGVFLSLIVIPDLQSCSSAVLLPLAGIFVGLSFAWAGNAQALMQSSEIYKLSQFHEGGFVEYVFVYQTAILSILVTLVLWGLAGLGVFDMVWPTKDHPSLYFIVKAFLFVMASLTLRECWQVVMGASWMLRIQRRIKQLEGQD